jgi:peroxiredoxin
VLTKGSPGIRYILFIRFSLDGAWALKFKSFLRAVPLIAACSLFIMLAGCEEDGQVELNVGDRAPVFTLMDLNGKRWSLSELKGSVVLINFWATWCPPCKEELPSLQRLFVKTVNDRDLIILTILYRDEPRSAAEYIRENGFDITVLIDPEFKTAAEYGLTGVPETFVVDKKGILRKKIIGPTQFDIPDAVAFLNKLSSE